MRDDACLNKARRDGRSVWRQRCQAWWTAAEAEDCARRCSDVVGVAEGNRRAAIEYMSLWWPLHPSRRSSSVKLHRTAGWPFSHLRVHRSLGGRLGVAGVSVCVVSINRVFLAGTTRILLRDTEATRGDGTEAASSASRAGWRPDYLNLERRQSKRWYRAVNRVLAFTRCTISHNQRFHEK